MVMEPLNILSDTYLFECIPLWSICATSSTSTSPVMLPHSFNDTPSESLFTLCVKGMIQELRSGGWDASENRKPRLQRGGEDEPEAAAETLNEDPPSEWLVDVVDELCRWDVKAVGTSIVDDALTGTYGAPHTLCETVWMKPVDRTVVVDKIVSRNCPMTSPRSVV